MDGTQKKISFGFSKLKQTSQLVKPVVIKKEEVQYVDSFDGEKGKFSFQGNLRIDEEVKKPLVIPLIGTRTAYDVIKSKIDSRDGNIVEPPDNAQDGKTESEVQVKKEPIDEEIVPPKETEIENGQVQVKEEKNVDEIPKPVSLDVLAAKELLEGVKKEKDDEENGTGRVIVPEEKPVFEGEKESTLEDYENVPVGDYGLALLRGMGWTPKTGIGKENKVVAPVASKVRPKRLGLGAEVALIPPGERPPLKKGCLIKVAVGQYKNDVGVVESLEGDTGSVFVKLQISGNLCLSENVIQTLTKKEYDDIQNNGGPKIQAAPKPAGEKKYGIVFKDDQSKKPQTKDEEKPRQIASSKHKSERQKYESKRKSRSISPRRKDKDTKKVSKSRRSDHSSDDNHERNRRRREYSSEEDKTYNDRSRRRRDSSSENRRRKRRSRDRSSSNEDYKKKQKKGRSHDRSLSSNDSKDRTRKRSKSKDRKKKKSHKRSSSSEHGKSRRKDRRTSSSDEELRKRKKKKKRKKKSHDSD